MEPKTSVWFVVPGRPHVSGTNPFYEGTYIAIFFLLIILKSIRLTSLEVCAYVCVFMCMCPCRDVWMLVCEFGHVRVSHMWREEDNPSVRTHLPLCRREGLFVCCVLDV